VVFEGLAGFLEGEEFVLEPGKVYTVGRSSLCDISLKRTRKYEDLEKEGRLLGRSFRYTSRKHFTLRVVDDCVYAETSSQLKVRVSGSIKVEIKCLSPNGLLVDGREVTEMIIPELGKSVFTLEFGGGEKAKLYLRRLH